MSKRPKTKFTSEKQKIIELRFFLSQLGIYSGWFLLMIILLYIISGYSIEGKAFLGIKLNKTLALKIHTQSTFYLILFLMLHIVPYLILKIYKPK